MQEISLVAVSAPGCHNCAVFKSFWDTEQAKWPQVKFTEVNLMTKDAAPILMKHRILASPGILINDELFSVGPVDHEALLAQLKKVSEQS